MAIRFVHDHDVRLAALLVRVLMIGMTWLESVFQRFISTSLLSSFSRGRKPSRAMPFGSFVGALWACRRNTVGEFGRIMTSYFHKQQWKRTTLGAPNFLLLRPDTKLVWLLVNLDDSNALPCIVCLPEFSFEEFSARIREP